MSQPGRLLSLFKDVASSLEDEEKRDNSITGDIAVDEVIRTLSTPDLVKLLVYVREWNTNGKTSSIAQRILFAVFKLWSADDIIRAFGESNTQKNPDAGDEGAELAKTQQTVLHDVLEALISYSERHLARMDKLVQESFVVDYILGEMDDGMFDNELENDEMQVD